MRRIRIIGFLSAILQIMLQNHLTEKAEFWRTLTLIEPIFIKQVVTDDFLCVLGELLSELRHIQMSSDFFSF